MEYVQFRNGDEYFVAFGPNRDNMKVVELVGGKFVREARGRYPSCLKFMPYAEVSAPKTATGDEIRSKFGMPFVVDLDLEKFFDRVNHDILMAHPRLLDRGRARGLVGNRNLYVRSRRAGQRVMASVTDFLARRLKLTVNAAKSAVDRPSARAFLGFKLHGRTDAPAGRLAEGARPVRL